MMSSSSFKTLAFLTCFIFSALGDYFPSNSSSYMLTDDDGSQEGVDVIISSAAPSKKPTSRVSTTKPAISISPTKKLSKTTVAPSFKVGLTKAPSIRPTMASTIFSSTTTYGLLDLISLETFHVKSSVNLDNSGSSGTSHSKAQPTFSPVPTVRPTTVLPTKTEKPMSPTLNYNVKSKSPTKNPSFRATAVPSLKPTAKPTQSPLDDISYHGGAIMTGTVNAYNIYYGDISSSTKDLVNYFAANLGNSSWYSTLTPYYQIVNGVKTFVSKSLVLKKSVDVAATKTVLNVNDVVLLVVDLFNTGKLAVDANGVYSLFFRGDLSVIWSVSPGTVLYWLVDFCGYHGAFRLSNGLIIKFMVIGDPSYATNGHECEEIRATDPGGTANNNVGADSMVTVYAHEIAETVTNYNGQWYFDSNALENADACYWDFGDYVGNSNVVVGNKRFLVQQMWVPTIGCVMSL